jgi:hypothetical protein
MTGLTENYVTRMLRMQLAEVEPQVGMEGDGAAG